MSKLIEKTINEEQTVVVDQQKIDCLAQPNTSKRIRFLLSIGKTRGEIVKLCREYGITTKDGSPIIYQFVNNVMNTKVK